MSASQTLESYLAAFKRHPKPSPQYRPSILSAKLSAKRPAYDADSISVSTVSSIDTEMLLRSDTSEIVAKEAHRNRERIKGKHKKNVHSMPLSIIQENSELAGRSYFAYNIHDYLPQSSAAYQYCEPRYVRPGEVRAPPTSSRRGKQQYRQPRAVVEKQSTVSSVDTDALLQSSDEEYDVENFPISHLTKELLDKRHAPLPAYRPESRESISPRYNPVVSIGNTSRASPLPGHARRDADIQMPLISPSPDLTTHTRTMSMPISPARGRKLSETTTVMVENNKQILLCPSQRSEEKASLESTLQKCLGAQGTYFQDPPSSRSKVPGASTTPKFSNKPNLQLKHPFDQSSSSRRGDSPPRPSVSSSSDPSEAFEAFCREQLPKSDEDKQQSHRKRRNKTYVRLKVCTCILAGMINSHKPGCKVTTVTALLPTRDSNNSSFGSLCNLKSGTTHSYLHSTGSRIELDSSRVEQQKKKKKFSVLEAVLLIQRKIREFLKRRKDTLSLAYSHSTNDRSSAPSDIERATRSIYSAIDHLQELKGSSKKSQPVPVSQDQDLLSMDELVVSVPMSEANSELLDLSGEQLGRVVRQGDIHAVTQNSWSEFLQRESGETLWIDASSSSIEGFGSKELALS